MRRCLTYFFSQGSLIVLSGPYSRASFKCCLQSPPSHLTSSSPPTSQQLPSTAVLSQSKDLRSAKDGDVGLKWKDDCLQHYSTKFFDDFQNKMLMKSLREYILECQNHWRYSVCLGREIHRAGRDNNSIPGWKSEGQAWGLAGPITGWGFFYQNVVRIVLIFLGCKICQDCPQGAAL